MCFCHEYLPKVRFYICFKISHIYNMTMRVPGKYEIEYVLGSALTSVKITALSLASKLLQKQKGTVTANKIS